VTGTEETGIGIEETAMGSVDRSERIVGSRTTVG
jgi:hypothetical protein